MRIHNTGTQCTNLSHSHTSGKIISNFLTFYKEIIAETYWGKFEFIPQQWASICSCKEWQLAVNGMSNSAQKIFRRTDHWESLPLITTTVAELEPPAAVLSLLEPEPNFRVDSGSLMKRKWRTICLGTWFKNLGYV